jgi:K+-transporting ATPase KdpF subunit
MSRSKIMITDPLIALVVAVGLGVYLVYTLVRPEKF